MKQPKTLTFDEDDIWAAKPLKASDVHTGLRWKNVKLGIPHRTLAGPLASKTASTLTTSNDIQRVTRPDNRR